MPLTVSSVVVIVTSYRLVSPVFDKVEFTFTPQHPIAVTYAPPWLVRRASPRYGLVTPFSVDSSVEVNRDRASE